MPEVGRLLSELLAGLEGDVEFKERLGRHGDIARTVIAFANGRGGRLIVGVADEPRRVVGLDPDSVPEWERTIASVIHDRCEPAIRPVMTIERYEDDKIVLIVSVFPGADKPYHLRAESPEAGTFIRVGSTNRLADRATILQLTREAWHTPFDEASVEAAELEDLDREAIGEFLERRRRLRDLAGGPPDDSALEKLKLVTRRQGRGLVPTVAGVLYFAKQPQRFFPYARIRCARFQGLETRVFLDQAEVGGRVPEQIEGAMAFVLRNTRLRGVLRGARREDRPEYPPDAVRETIANAVAHRDYTIVGADIRVAIFDDRIEVTSPGVLPAGITLLHLGEGASEPRNPILATLLRDAGYAEQWGLGIRRMIEAMRTWGLPRPRFEEIDRSFRVILPGAVEGADQLNGRQLLALRLAADQAGLRKSVYVANTGVSSMTAHKDLRRLVELGLLRVDGRGPATRYRLPSS